MSYIPEPITLNFDPVASPYALHRRHYRRTRRISAYHIRGFLLASAFVASWALTFFFALGGHL